MFDLDRWTEIADALRQNRLRTLLTALGVFWGMFMLVVMLGFGDGLERGVKRNMGGWATNAVYVWGGRTSMPYKGMRPGRFVRYDNADAAALAQLPNVEHLAPRNQLGGWREGNNVVHGSKTGNYSVMGDYPVFREIATFEIVRGRFVNDIDMADRRKVAVIGEQIYKELFAPGEDPVGSYIRIKGIFFQVVGQFRFDAANDRADRENSTIYIPFTTFQRVFNYGDHVGWFAITAKPEVPASEMEESVRALLAERHKIHPEDDEGIGSFNSEKEFGQITTLFTGIRFFVWFVGVMTLLAGVIGVSNIMLIVVRERTSEIGLRRAIGATPLSVVVMIVQEAVALTAVAGYAGLVAGVALLEAVAAVVPADSTMGEPTLSLGPVLVAGLVLLLAGAMAGVIPARNAAAIRPVEALHSE